MRIIFTGLWLLRIPLILAVIYILQTSAVGIWWSMTISIIIMYVCCEQIQRQCLDKGVCGQDGHMLFEACSGEERQ
jgi:Na+-driven multidrug efflux pump